MANLFTPSLVGANGPWYIDREDCLGDSLQYINANTNYLAAYSASQTAAVSAITQQVIPTTLFVPANFSTLSNSNENLTVVNWSATGTRSSLPWWSGTQTATFSNVPTNAIAALIEIYFNTNAGQNNGQSLLIRKDSSEAWNSPQDQGAPATPGNISVAQKNNINYNYTKISLDPTGSSATVYEGEHSVTTIVYFNTTSKSFQWFTVDGRDAGIPAQNPYYGVNMKVIGYYLSITT